MIQIISKFLLFIYNIKRSNSIRKLIKKTIGNKKIQVKFNDFKIDAGINSAIESNIIFNEYNEITVLKIIKNYCSKQYHFIDVGANIGLHSLTAASSNANIEIFSFEPEPDNYLSFIRNIGHNDFVNIRPFRMGVGNFNGNTILNINEGWNKGKHSLKVSFNESTKKAVIPVIQLNNFKENLKFESLLIKIDVEGFEKEVIEGASQVFSNAENLVLIIELVTEINELETCKEIIETLKNYGFEKIYKINSNNDCSSVIGYEGSADYIFIKGKHAIENFIK
ncbi:MAG: FkbM family methyltransferase [Flavobacterium sp.]